MISPTAPVAPTTATLGCTNLLPRLSVGQMCHLPPESLTGRLQIGPTIAPPLIPVGEGLDKVKRYAHSRLALARCLPRRYFTPLPRPRPSPQIRSRSMRACT